MNEFSRRDFLKNGTLTAGALAMGLSLKGGPALAAPPAKAKVFFTRDLSAEGLLNIYAKVNEGMTGKVASNCTPANPTGRTFCPAPGCNGSRLPFPTAPLWSATCFTKARARLRKGTGNPEDQRLDLLRRGHYGRRGRRQPARARRQTAQGSGRGQASA